MQQTISIGKKKKKSEMKLNDVSTIKLQDIYEKFYNDKYK